MLRPSPPVFLAGELQTKVLKYLFHSKLPEHLPAFRTLNLPQPCSASRRMRMLLCYLCMRRDLPSSSRTLPAFHAPKHGNQQQSLLCERVADVPTEETGHSADGSHSVSNAMLQSLLSCSLNNAMAGWSLVCRSDPRARALLRLTL